MPLLDSACFLRPINIPPHLPLILKQFCKAAIRTQPYDLLKWSSAYFRALAEGIEPPTKIRLEYPIPGTISGLTLGFLKVLLRQFGDYNKVLPVESILRRWDDLCLDRRDLNLIMIIGRFRHKCQVKKFLAIAIGLLGTTLFDTMLMVCELFTLEPDGGSGMIPISLFMELYRYLADLKCDGSKRDSKEENPSEFLVLNPSDPVIPQVTGNSEDNVELKAISLTSQDTDIDVELDHDNSTENSPNKSSTYDGDCEQQSEEKKEIPGDDHQSEVQRPYCPEKSTMMPCKLSSHYPNIAGIGPRLTTEQVDTVAVWMTGCARLQGGMVGPRNLRHFNCPPLDCQELLP